MDGDQTSNVHLLSRLLNTLSNSPTLPISISRSDVTLPRRDDECSICFEPWTTLVTDHTQRKWITTKICGHTICTNCYFTLTVVPIDSEDDDDELSDELYDELSGQNVGHKLRKQTKCPVCRATEANSSDESVVINKWDYLFALNKKANQLKSQTSKKKLAGWGKLRHAYIPNWRRLET
eukprot:Seg1915.3 transcript_id=Seg1915.3/GoldUCD/mRNA.D3Y31 product="hypothetical protein" protein_id=Seg1915.3/GoldUCD/D3Y31